MCHIDLTIPEDDSPLLPVGVGADVDLPVGSGIGKIRSQHSRSGNSLARAQQDSATSSVVRVVSRGRERDARHVTATRGVTRAVGPSCPVIGPNSRPGPGRGQAYLRRAMFRSPTVAASCGPRYRVPLVSKEEEKEESSSSLPPPLPRVTSMLVPAARSSSSSHIHTRILHLWKQLPPAEARNAPSAQKRRLREDSSSPSMPPRRPFREVPRIFRSRSRPNSSTDVRDCSSARSFGQVSRIRS